MTDRTEVRATLAYMREYAENQDGDATLAAGRPSEFIAIADLVAAQDAEISRLRGLLWYGWKEMNAIRAMSGVPLDFHGHPQAIEEGYWASVVDAMATALGGDAMPWPSAEAIVARAKEATP